MAKMCPKAGQCGSCAFNGVKYSVQLDRKREWLEETVGTFGPVAPVLGMEHPFRYRNKVQAVFGYSPKGEIISGIYRQGTHMIIPVKDCMIEDSKADEILTTIRTLVKRLSITIYDEDEQVGFLRHVLIKRAFETDQIMVVLVVGTFNYRGMGSFVKALLAIHPDITTVLANLNNQKTSMVLSEEPERVLYGPGFIEDKLCGLKFRISAKSFFQVNPVQAAKMYEIAMRMARFKGGEHVIDAYCGTGTISLIAASKGVASVVGIENNPVAVEDAINNAKENGLTNVSFVTADASDELKRMAKEKEKVDVLFLDPPRSGSNERFLSSVIKLSPKTVIYISCNPETLARDLRYLLNMSNYQVVGIQGIDMFPQTAALETVVLLEDPS